MRIKNWHKFQHFKDRTPPWIKLHRTILERRDIATISDGSFRVLVGLWLLASEDKEHAGNLPPVEDIAFRLRLSKSKVDNALQELSEFIVNDDIKAISKRYQSDSPETETEKEKEVEKEVDKSSPLNNRSTTVQRPLKQKTYKQWDEKDFLESIKSVQSDECILDDDDSRNRFFMYWTEPDARGKMKFQKQKTWETKRRMITWRDNQDKFGNSGGGGRNHKRLGTGGL